MLLPILCALKTETEADLELVVESKSIATYLQYGKGVVHAYAVPRACGLVGAQVLVVRLINFRSIVLTDKVLEQLAT